MNGENDDSVIENVIHRSNLPRGGPRFDGAQAIPLSLYIHLPWCLRKCPYCDFNSHERTITPADESDYVQALTADLELALPAIWGRPVQTVFIGGGTPSLFSPASIEALLAMVRARVRLAPDAEVTMEANPGTFERRRFADFRAAGVTRLSIGVQSFDDASLARIGRVHDGAQARAAAQAAGELFDTFNLDLMYALPGQTLEALQRDLETALSLGPPHLSVYHLTIEPNTRFARFPPVVPDDDAAFDMQEAIEQRLGAAGYDHYEVSAHARPGHRCLHNLNYWQFGDYLGIGAGAHSKLTFHDRIERRVAVRHPQQYVAAVRDGKPLAERHDVEPQELPFEFMLNALRLTDGVPTSMFAERTGLSPVRLSRAMRSAVDRGLLDAGPSRLKATPTGGRFLNDLIGLFLPERSD